VLSSSFVTICRVVVAEATSVILPLPDAATCRVVTCFALTCCGVVTC
jgi:hypothetical protein